MATTDPDTLPEGATWYLATNLPRPGGPRQGDSAHQAADLTEIVRLYGLRNWIEQSYKQVKDFDGAVVRSRWDENGVCAAR